MAFQFIAFTPCSGSSGTYFVASYDAAFWTAVQGTTVTFDSYQVNACFQPSLPGIIINPGDPPPAGYDPSVDLTTIAYSTYNTCSECLENVSPTPNYKLVDCDNPGNTLCISNTLVPGLLAAVQIEGYPNTCWTITTDPLCTNPVYVTFTNVFKNGCPECKQTLPVTNYELRSCQDDTVIYTSTDLSEFADPEQVVTLDGYDGCYFVRVVTGIPGDSPVIVTGSFADCELCQATYYQLTACAPDDALDPIVTITDLSAYEGLVITLASCPDVCWFVEKTTPVENPQVLQFLEKYDTCIDCVTKVKECKCTSAVRSDIGPGGLRYVDCNGGIRTTPVLQTGERSEKLCTLYWITGDEIIEYGTCIEGQCPTTPQPKRAVTPGYNTPVCSTDYYEKVECAFGESMYKDVLSERYGISNCCPENDMKWIIKHEMLMLDILVNPDYTCTPITSCNCPVIGGTVLNTVCPEVTNYILERCNEPGITEVVRIENQYDVLGNVIVIDDQCYTVVAPTNRLVTVYWTPGTIYGTCTEAGCPPPLPSWRSEACVFGFMDTLNFAFNSGIEETAHTITSLVINGLEYITLGNEYAYQLYPLIKIPANNQYGETYTNQVDSMNNLFSLLGLEELVKAQIVTNDIWAFTAFGTLTHGGFYLILAPSVNTISFIIEDNTGWSKTFTWDNGVASVSITEIEPGFPSQNSGLMYEWSTCSNIDDDPFIVIDGVVNEPPF